MQLWSRPGVAALLVGASFLVAAVIGGCGDRTPPPAPALDAAGLRALLAEQETVVLTPDVTSPATIDAETRDTIDALAAAGWSSDGLTEIVVDSPLDESVFPPEIVAPTFLWHDDAADVDAWLVDVAFADDGPSLRAVARGDAPRRGPIDREAQGPTNELPNGTPYQQSARSWTPPPEMWEEMKRRSPGTPILCSILGFDTHAAARPLSRGQVHITTSKDPVGAPIFYRDVPLMPAKGKKGVIAPLEKSFFPLIQWRLRDISEPESRIVLTGMPTCANCHSFSLDGKTLGMDVDGPQGDKGAYMISPVAKHMVVDSEQVITWNSFPDKPEGHKTIGFLSRISPDGEFALTTLNEALYVANFTDYQFLQVFYPTRGILAWYSLDTGEMKALPGADDERYVHTNGVWTPDGKEIVFSRAEAFDPYLPDGKIAEYANDPNEPKIRYDLYRMPFNDGKGGTPVIIEGASDNGASNTFPKVSPDGKWIVFTKCDNGQLMRPDGRLWIVPIEGGEAREMRCNTSRMNSWHSFSPNGRWMVFSSKENTPYTQMFLTHIDEDGGDSPRILVPNATAANRAVNIPEFMNAQYEDLLQIEIPAVNHHRFFQQALELLKRERPDEAIPLLEQALAADPIFGRAHMLMAELLRNRGDREGALAHYRLVLQTTPLNAEALCGMGSLLFDMGREEEAIDHFARAVKAAPGHEFARANLSGVLRSRGLRRAASGEPDQGIEDLEWAVTVSEKDAVIRRDLARLLFEQGRVTEAVVHEKEALEHDPNDTRARIRLAWLLATHSDPAVRDGVEAVMQAEVACRQTDYSQAQVLDVLAAAYAEAGRFEDAVEIARRAVAIARDSKRSLARRIEARLALYERNEPFHSDEP